MTMFENWCALHSLRPVPVAPAEVARFISDVAALGIGAIWPAVCDISRAHYVIGLADPTMSGPVSAAIARIAPIEPPRSWRKEHKHTFPRLPYDLQVYLSRHEAQRDKEIHRAHDEAAKARQALEAIQHPKVTHGNQPHSTA